ncbi:hypothetical protein F5Y19DRAFT_493144 [Xylariaceae sp. FL1651]|nr:hypothetical protein F5Y19DRAFT_493144 [Xylariaceae sp. FL1651]
MSAPHPIPFDVDSEISETLPILDADDVNHLTAVLRGLAQGRCPRVDAVPRALNAYNFNKRNNDNGKKTWAYFHSITDVASVDDRPPRNRPGIMLNDNVLDDLEIPWHTMRPNPRGGGMLAGEPPSYRFVCFIHKHRIPTKYSGKKAVYTISIWDRECDELTWHDTYIHSRRVRRAAVRRFWEEVFTPGLPFTHPRREFLAKIRYRTAYHTCEAVEATIRDAVAPHHTLWAVMAIALHHMNHGAVDRQVSIVPDKLEVFGGQARELLPALFAHLLCLCLRAPRQDREGEGEDKEGDGGEEEGNDDDDDGHGRGDDRSMRAFVEKFKIIDRLTWMKTRVRRLLEARMGQEDGVWLRDMGWLFRALRIEYPL